MESRVNYMITGAFVLLFGAALLGFVFWMGKFGDRQKSYDLYKVLMDESVSGLNVESPVKLNGLEIGTVRKIAINPEDPDRIEVILQIAKGTPLRGDHIAILGSQGITGLKYIEITRDKKADPSRHGMELPRDAKGYRILPPGKSLLRKLEETADNLSEKIDGTLERVNRLFSDDNLENISVTLKHLKQSSRQISSLLEHHGEKSMNELTGTMTEIRKLAQKLQREIDRGSFNFKKMTDDSLRHVDEVLVEMKKTLHETQTMVEDLRQSPSDILFKSQAVRYGPGEQQ